MSRGLISSPGYSFLASSSLLVLLGWLLHWGWLWWPGLASLIFFGYFFRDPERRIPPDPEVVVAPADGKVILADEVIEERFLNGPARRVAIFMNVFDVHVNRAPSAGTVQEAQHRDGCFKAAFREESSAVNEQMALVLEEVGRRLLVVQIAGLLARRIVSYVQPGQHLEKGERLGMICFGSRVDLYLPMQSQLMVKVGDRVKAGSSIVARWT
ncbi:MAG: phosphatidylserine decarboxylase family protein [Desulfobaccales bacterium]|jgi:phosphatidylserine decarboxylase